MLGDHLGSASITTDSAGAKVSEMRYTPWGEVRYHWVDSNLSTTPAYKLPVYSFTGQRSYMDDPSTTAVEGFGLMDYNARMYDPAIGKFVSADSIVTGGIQGYDRYIYGLNNPSRFVDPTGHMVWEGEGGGNSKVATGPSSCSTGTNPIEKHYMKQTIKATVLKGKGFTIGNAVASIGVQNPLLARGELFYTAKQYCYQQLSGFLNNFTDSCESSVYYTGKGLAKVSDAAMVTPFGMEVPGGHGYGVGLNGLDQTKPEVAVVAMQLRIQIMFDKYLDYCAGNTCNNNTNNFLLAAMAGNGIEKEDIGTLYNGFGLQPPREDGVFDWEGWIRNNKTRLKVLQDFVNNWVWLESQGFELPNDIDWDYICNLLDLTRNHIVKKKCIFWITIVPLVLILVLCGLTVIYFEFLYYDPDVFPNSSRQPEEGGFLINPATILQSLNTGNTDVFSPYFEQTEGPTNVFIDKSIDWIPNDYLVIAEALNNKVWGDSLNDWKIYEMVFLLRCKEKPRGFEKSHLIYFKTVFNDNGRKEYVIREFFIEPKSAYVMWRGGAEFSASFYWMEKH